MFSFWIILIFLISLTSFTSSLVIPKPSNLNPRSSTLTQDTLKRGMNPKALDEDEAELARIQKVMDDEIWEKWSYAHMIHGSGSRAAEVLSISTVA
ncbi:uncharacterized protein MELLADRAFT_72842 [Melampsora larici-populina 98AG31]|uniref:Secreted protein n=1 Tax=Melampsora larici-populina (strain 98AG31 / pathotype 3-4-7) TaxID=747676 RepID=F4RZT2_MELLP|nr:uncharacterized protein MELLADRAFT_72842 [Melampsora larici-populina 98AG31]EGG02135.1 secreted protein [Melampsora larici-populina 98AG31]